MIRRAYLVGTRVLFCVKHPSPTTTPERKCLVIAVLIQHSDLSTLRSGTQRQGWWSVGHFARVLRRTREAAQSKLYKILDICQGGTWEPKSTLCAKMSLIHIFLDFRTRLRFSLTLLATGREPCHVATGEHMHSIPSGNVPRCGDSVLFLLFCFHRSFCSLVEQYHFVLDLPETKTFPLLYEIHLGINGFLKPNQKKKKKVKTKQINRNKTQSLLTQANNLHVVSFHPKLFSL